MQNGGVTFERLEDSLGRHVEQLFEEFLDHCWDDEADLLRTGGDQAVERALYYRAQFEALEATTAKSTVLVDFRHLQEHDDLLAQSVADNYYRLEPFLRNALNIVATRHLQDPLLEGQETKDLWVAFYNLPAVLKVRDLKTQCVGKLACVSGTVTRTSQVRPELLQGRFQCLDCQTPSDLIEQQFRYTEPIRCRNAACQNTRRWLLLVPESRFCDWQKARVQENSDEIPSGSLPRSLEVILRNDAVEMAKAGDKCRFVGTLVVVPEVAKLFSGVDRREVIRGQAGGDLRAQDGRSDMLNPTEGATGLKQLGVRDLNYRLCFLATTVHSEDEKQGFRMMTGEGPTGETLTEAEEARVAEMARDDHLRENLARTMCPNVWGHDDIKNGILLQLFGGVHKRTREGIALRGDINCCIVGDPSVAKSQFLKYVHNLIPRAVYTSGKASSAAGLTASVVKDPETREYGIEAGALMLADNGLCCIDEFDKMDVDDQVAIHEAMEQQTISIAKAGIKATLNARTCILAAANPIGGRYDVRKSLKQNIGLSPPILSRFDLFFVVLDDNDPEGDYRLADHIVGVHQFGDTAVPTVYTAEEFLLYRRRAKAVEPVLTPAAVKLLVTSYVELRQNDKTSKNNNRRPTTRQLESMIRLSEAEARLHLSPEVREEHVRQALKVMRMSLARAQQPTVVIPTTAAADAAQESAASTDPQAAVPPATARIAADAFVRTRELIRARLKRNDGVRRDGMLESELKSWYFDTVRDLNEDWLLEHAETFDGVLAEMLRLELVIPIGVSPEGERVVAINPNEPDDPVPDDR